MECHRRRCCACARRTPRSRSPGTCSPLRCQRRYARASSMGRYSPPCRCRRASKGMGRSSGAPSSRLCLPPRSKAAATGSRPTFARASVRLTRPAGPPGPTPTGLPDLQVASAVPAIRGIRGTYRPQPWGAVAERWPRVRSVLRWSASPAVPPSTSPAAGPRTLPRPECLAAVPAHSVSAHSCEFPDLPVTYDRAAHLHHHPLLQSRAVRR